MYLERFTMPVDTGFMTKGIQTPNQGEVGTVVLT